MFLETESHSNSTGYLLECRMHLSSVMTLRITTGSDGQRTTLRLSGRIRSTDIENVRDAMKGKAERIVLDLEEVTLVELGVVRFLGVRKAWGWWRGDLFATNTPLC